MPYNLFMFRYQTVSPTSNCTSILFYIYYTVDWLYLQSLWVRRSSSFSCSIVRGSVICNSVAKFAPITNTRNNNQIPQKNISSCDVAKGISGQATYSNKPANNKRKIG